MKEFFAAILFTTILASCNTCTVKTDPVDATEAVDSTAVPQDTTAVDTLGVE